MIGQLNTENPDTLPAMIAQAEALKNRKEFLQAGEYYEKAMELCPGDTFLIKRMALVTYKSKLPDAVTALHKAQFILSVLKPEESTDAETLGLSGAINKKLHELTGDESCLENALWFYARGFSISQDYYNGINLAYLYLKKAADSENKAEALLHYEKAVNTNEKVIAFCIKLIIAAGFEHRNDREYVYQTLAQAHLGLGQDHEVIKLIPTINEVSKGSFDLDIFHEQNSRLIDALVKVRKKYPDII
jgi:tetratricopeptide (TPR) repeat protein